VVAKVYLDTTIKMCATELCVRSRIGTKHLAWPTQREFEGNIRLVWEFGLDLVDLFYVSEADWCRAGSEFPATIKGRKINKNFVEDSSAWI